MAGQSRTANKGKEEREKTWGRTRTEHWMACNTMADLRSTTTVPVHRCLQAQVQASN